MGKSYKKVITFTSQDDMFISKNKIKKSFWVLDIIQVGRAVLSMYINACAVHVGMAGREKALKVTSVNDNCGA